MSREDRLPLRLDRIERRVAEIQEAGGWPPLSPADAKFLRDIFTAQRDEVGMERLRNRLTVA
jgi:hypothetical protein